MTSTASGSSRTNLAAIRSLTGYRALRWGANVELILTDQHSYRSEDLSARPSVDMPGGDAWLDLYPEEAVAMLDAGRTYDGGRPPATLPLGGPPIANIARDQPPQTILGATQKKWFKERLLGSRATWKIWGNTLGTLDYRMDPLNLPKGVGGRWPGAGYACLGGGDPQHGVCRAGRDLRCRSGRGPHRFRHHRRRPPQFLGRLRGRGAAAEEVRAGRGRVRHGFRCRHLGSSRPASTRSGRTTRCGRSTSRTAMGRSPSPRSTWRCVTACDRRSTTLRIATSRARLPCLIRTSRRISPSSIWLATDTPS